MTISLEQFKQNTLGGSYGNPGTGTYLGECTSYCRQYMEQVLGIKTVPYGNALSWFDNPVLARYFDQITDGSRQDGDLLCWTDDKGSWTGIYGHIGISYGGKLLNQNYNGSKKVSINPFFSEGYQGALRRKGGTNVAIIGNQSNWRARLDLETYIHWRRNLTDAEFAYFVGKDTLAFMEWVGDNPETKRQIELSKIDEEGVRILAAGILQRPEPLVTTPDLKTHIGASASVKIKEFWYSPEGKKANELRQKMLKEYPGQAQNIAELEVKVAELEASQGVKPTPLPKGVYEVL